jgi:hypothetical protein
VLGVFSPLLKRTITVGFVLHVGLRRIVWSLTPAAMNVSPVGRNGCLVRKNYSSWGIAIMSRKHFQAIADAVLEAVAVCELSPRQHVLLAGVLASLCGQFNGRFDRDRFMRACGVE